LEYQGIRVLDMGEACEKILTAMVQEIGIGI
jgi:hypothetical protein